MAQENNYIDEIVEYLILEPDSDFQQERISASFVIEKEQFATNHEF